MPVSRVLLRALSYAACGAGLAYCSAAPSYEQLPPDTALLRLSMTVAGARLAACRSLTPQELERLAPNMRRAEQCPRERSSVRVRLVVDEETLVDEVIAPKGWVRDGAATIYRRIVLPAGHHQIRAAVNDDLRQKNFRHVGETHVELAAGRVLTVDFDAEAAGVSFR